MSGRIWLIGAGNMGGAILRGWLGSGMDPSTILAIDPIAKSLSAGVEQVAELPVDEVPDSILLAVKPQQLSELAGLYGGRAGARLLLSVLAGVEVSTLRASFGATHVVRAMPNLPAAIGKGVTVLFNDDGDAALRAEVATLVEPLGFVEWIEQEGLFDAVTAVSGSGPGFVFRFIEAMAEAGARLGLPRDQALRLALATVEGSATMARSSDVDPATLADRVASPGGTTREGLNVLDENSAIKTLMARTLEATARRNAELAAAAVRAG